MLTELYDTNKFDVANPFIVKIKKTSITSNQHIKTVVRLQSNLYIAQVGLTKYYLMHNGISYTPFGKEETNFLLKQYTLNSANNVSILEFFGMPVHTSILGIQVSTIISSLTNYFTNTAFIPASGTTYGLAFPEKFNLIRSNIWPNLCKITLNQINNGTDLFLDGEIVLPVALNPVDEKILYDKCFTSSTSTVSISITSSTINRVYCVVKSGDTIPSALLVTSKSGNWIDIQSNERVDYISSLGNTVGTNLYEYMPVNPNNLPDGLPTPASLGLELVEIPDILNFANYIGTYVNRLVDLRTLGIIVAFAIAWFLLNRA